MKTDFMHMLHELPGLSAVSFWIDVRPRLEADPRFRAVPSNSLKEEWFREFCSGLDKVSIVWKIADM
jgi:FF domain